MSILNLLFLLLQVVCIPPKVTTKVTTKILTDIWKSQCFIVLLYFFIPNHFYNEGYAPYTSIYTVGGGGSAEKCTNFDRIQK